MKNLLRYFDLKNDREDYLDVVKTIERDVALVGANLWILIFAIFLASLGLNVNSTAVIIGAMLISPLMGPIMGLGLGMGINDLDLLRKSLFSYLFAAGVGLATSTLYFSITPLNAAHSEILARTSPNIYDVLIAFFGGLAGIIAVTFKHKGNVIPGVAIATALMPPLCTAGYGLATLNMAYFFGAFYLFLINTVFIALATLLAVRLLKFHHKRLLNPEAEARAGRIALFVVLITLIPSVYFGYRIVQKEKFTQNANKFIQYETYIPSDYLLEKSVDADKRSIVLTYGGKKILAEQIEQMKAKLVYYNLENATLSVQQGFDNLGEVKSLEKANPLKQVLAEKEHELLLLKNTIDSLNRSAINTKQITGEAKALYPNLINMAFTMLPPSDTTEIKKEATRLVYMQFSKIPDRKEKQQIQNWLETRLSNKVKVVMDQ